MSKAFSGLFSNNQQEAIAADIQQQQNLATSQQGQQLKLISSQQAQSDQEAAQLNKPGIGRAMLQFQRPGGGGAMTLGG